VIIRQYWPLLSRNGFGDLFAKENSLKVSVLEADSSLGCHASLKFHEFVIQKIRQMDFFTAFRCDKILTICLLDYLATPGLTERGSPKKPSRLPFTSARPTTSKQVDANLLA